MTQIDKKELKVKTEVDKQKMKAEKRAMAVRISQARAEELERKAARARNRSESDILNSEGPYGTNSEPRKSFATYLRNKNRLVVNAIAIMDRKAAILIQICTTLISAAVVFNSYIVEEVVSGSVIITILIIGLMLSLALAVLATKPPGLITRKLFVRRLALNDSPVEENMFLLGDYVSMKEYEAAMMKIVKSQNLQIGNQIRANYMIALHNGLRSKMLDLSYTIFLASFIFIGIVFLIGKFS